MLSSEIKNTQRALHGDASLLSFPPRRFVIDEQNVSIEFSRQCDRFLFTST